MTQRKLIFAIAIVFAVMVISATLFSLHIQRRAQARLNKNDVVLQQQQEQLVELTAENLRLSNRLTRAEQTVKVHDSNSENHATELADLRARAESLRQQADQAAKIQAARRRTQGAIQFSLGDSNLLNHNRELAISGAGTPRAEGKMND